MSSVKRGSNTDALCLHKSICITDSFHRAKPVNRDEAKRNRGYTAESRSSHPRFNESTVSPYIKEENHAMQNYSED